MKSARLGIEEVTTYSDRISNLPDDLLLRILSLIPVKNAMSTNLLSKRWKSVWKMMQILEYDETCPYNGSLGFEQFCDSCLPLLHEPPLLKTLTLQLMTKSKSIDSLLFPNIPSTLLEMTITSFVYPCFDRVIRFSDNLNVFKTLVVLKLVGKLLLDLIHTPVCFRSLKNLHLKHVTFWGEVSFCKLLSACPVLEDLVFERRSSSSSDVLTPSLFTISVPSLQRLFITTDIASCGSDDLRFEINAPCLKYLNIFERLACFNFDEDMPKLVEAIVEVKGSETDKFLRFFKSVEFLSLNLFASMVLPLADRVSHHLIHLQLHIYNQVPRNLLLHLLKHSPKLKILRLTEMHLSYTQDIKDQQHSIHDPSSVPECVSFHLETFHWRGYEGTHEEIEIATYILKNASCLKTASIFIHAKGPRGGESDQMMIKKLKSTFKASTSCHLIIKLKNSW